MENSPTNEEKSYVVLGKDIFSGRLVRLAAFEETDIEPITKWMQNAELMRYLWSSPIYLQTAADVREFFDGLRIEQRRHNAVLCSIRTLDNDELIGHMFLTRIDPISLDCQFGIAIDNPDFWGGGYGSDATAIALRFAFMELNRHRVSLRVYEYNQRGIRSYEKLGFQHEGRIRDGVTRDGQWFDICLMGILRSEWKDGLA